MARNKIKSSTSKNVSYSRGRVHVSKSSSTFNTKTGVSSSSSRSFGYSIFGVVFLILIVAVLFAKFANRNIPSEGFFTSFLEKMQTAPTISMDWLSFFDNWSMPELAVPSGSVAQFLLGMYVFAAKLFNILASVFKFICFICTALLNALVFVLWGVSWLFFG